ncbi:DNA-directed RNA polymerase III subunit RPC8 isoform X2 [Xiphophorus couchianus]|uniref:DNA-directed RNA polymerase III subunit RPC8 isoform X2 n=1 Tax=Xiphophorus couchianus TaxID=32473 RepID=UPI0010170B20|nr:DNA-directed RNA polymerase III subunit RPC8 isoform X2 [Xiphophorus couchianus]
MFVLVEMVDTVRIPPWVFDRQLNDAIAEELNKKLANKVVYNVGLCICLYDITKLEDSYIFPGDGASHTKVHFRFVVFHPFLDEILVGKIKYCSQEGVHGDHLRARTGSAVLVEQLAPQRRNKGRRGATESRRLGAPQPIPSTDFRDGGRKPAGFVTRAERRAGRSHAQEQTCHTDRVLLYVFINEKLY